MDGHRQPGGSRRFEDRMVETLAEWFGRATCHDDLDEVSVRCHPDDLFRGSRRVGVIDEDRPLEARRV